MKLRVSPSPEAHWKESLSPCCTTTPPPSQPPHGRGGAADPSYWERTRHRKRSQLLCRSKTSLRSAYTRRGACRPSCPKHTRHRKVHLSLRPRCPSNERTHAAFLQDPSSPSPTLHAHVTGRDLCRSAAPICPSCQSPRAGGGAPGSRGGGAPGSRAAHRRATAAQARRGSLQRAPSWCR